MNIWVALKENVKSVMILWQTTEICSNPGFLVEPGEKLLTRASCKLDAETISSWSYDMEGHAKKCVGVILRIGKQSNSTVLQCYNTMHG